MTDLITLVLGIPSLVEGFVDLGRAVMKYQSLERDHVELVEESIFFAKALQYYAGFVNTSDPRALNHPSRPLLEEALRNACNALQIAEGILNYWTKRLEDDPINQKKMSVKKRARAVFDKIGCARSTSHDADASGIVNLNILSKVSYLAFGSIEIKEAMARLTKWTSRFSQLLLTSPSLQLQQDAIGNSVSDDVAFVASARKRAESKNRS